MLPYRTAMSSFARDLVIVIFPFFASISSLSHMIILHRAGPLRINVGILISPVICVFIKIRVNRFQV